MKKTISDVCMVVGVGALAVWCFSEFFGLGLFGISTIFVGCAFFAAGIILDGDFSVEDEEDDDDWDQNYHGSGRRSA